MQVGVACRVQCALPGPDLAAMLALLPFKHACGRRYDPYGARADAGGVRPGGHARGAARGGGGRARRAPSGAWCWARWGGRATRASWRHLQAVLAKRGLEHVVVRSLVVVEPRSVHSFAVGALARGPCCTNARACSAFFGRE